MARTAIDAALDKVAFKCVRCDALMGQCECWIQLHCPDCGKTKTASRQPADPKGAKMIKLRCPKCWDAAG